MRTRWNGSVQSGNAPTWDKNRNDDYNMYRCMVIKVYYADDNDNITKNSQNPEVLYDVITLGGFQSGNVISNCRLSNKFSYSNRVLKAATKPLNKVPLHKNDGDIVYVKFIQGHSAYPIIEGVGQSIDDKRSAAKRSEGPRSYDEFNGLIQKIDNKGQFSITQFLGKTLDGIFTATNEVNYKWEALENEVVQETFKSGLKIVKDGKNDKVTITTAGGVVATIDGKSNNISLKAGSTEVLIDGASGKISLKGELIDLGASVSDLVTKFTELATAFQTHVHPYTDDGSPAITSVPLAPLLTTVGSQTVKVQS